MPDSIQLIVQGDESVTFTPEELRVVNAVSPEATVEQNASGAEIVIKDLAHGTTRAQIYNGRQGIRGDDGFSPVITSEAITGGHRITIVDASHPQGFTVDVMNGQDGAPGRDGTDGINGTDGKGIVSIEKTSTSGIEDTYTITYTTGSPTTFTVTNGQDGAPGRDGTDGANGRDGTNGTDGVSPTVTVTDITGGHRVTIADAEHPNGQTFDVMDGTDGQTGQTGPSGADGYSPTASVSKNGSTATITITDKNGTTTATVSDGSNGSNGQDGRPGADGYSPTASVIKSGSTATITITDKNGTTTATVSDGQNGTDGQTGPAGPGVASGGTQGQMLVKKSGTDYDTKWANQPSVPVQDVQVNGTSILNNGVANVPIASPTAPGVAIVRDSSDGLKVDRANRLILVTANATMIKGGTSAGRAITPSVQDAAAFYGLAKAAGDSTQSASSNAVGTYTDEAKSAISTMLNGPVSVSGTTPTITALPGIQYICGEVSTLDITLPESGCVDVVFESGSTPTVLTITPPTGQTVRWANGFDPTALDADTTYEINIMDGLGVAVGWT